MLSIFYHIAFFIISSYVLTKSISYAIYEIKNEQNKFGGNIVIVFTIFCFIFTNIVVWNN